MRKKIVVLVTLFVLLCGVTSCQSKPKSLRVCVDMDYIGYNSGFSIENVMEDFKSLVEELGGPTDIEFE